jgi:hypothetical protein
MFRHSDSVISDRVLISPTATGDIIMYKVILRKTSDRNTGNRKTDGRKTGHRQTGGSRMNIPDKHYVVTIPNLIMSSLIFCLW